MDVNARTLKSLEWERLKQYLAAECSALASRQLALHLELHDQPAVIELLLRESEEALRLSLLEGSDLAQEGLPDLAEPLQRLTAAAALSAKELLDLKTVLVFSRRLKILYNNLDQDDFPALKKKAAGLFVFDELVNAIDKVVDESGGIKDDASPLLRKLRREVQRLNSQVKDELLRFINSPAGGKCLQEPIFTLRNGRHVLPVLANMRHAVEGIVHDSSSTGLTIYVEPKSVVELTNTIRISEAEIEREIERLLWEISAVAAGKTEAIRSSFDSLVEADFIAARARLARKYRASLPALSWTSNAGAAELRLLQARHPLLVLQSGKIESVVPNDIILDDKVKTLIITGPNTGGKTVYLKTAGLLSLMLRAGLLLPVAPGSTACIFQAIFADIGDEQSLEQNLSTFSSHMSNIVEITRQAGPSSLVLLDEIGAGTDPREGVILARVILGSLTESGAFTVCSTHYGQLKTLAHSQSGFANASMEFDDRNLTPSYRMRHGIAGNSHAIAVAARLGLPSALVDQAQLALDSEKQDFEQKIDQVEQRLRALADREEEIELKKTEMLKQEEELKVRALALAEEHRRSRLEAADRFQDDYRRARKVINELTADLQKTPSLARAQQARQRLESLKKELDWLEPEEYAAALSRIEPGQTVKVRSLGQIGVLEELSDQSGENALVRVGRMKVKVAVSDLEACPEAGQGKKDSAFKPHSLPASRKKGAVASTETSDPVFVRSNRNTLDLRGQRVDQGLALLERFIDEAYLEHISPIMVIHGHGTGAMKTAVRDFLQTCSYKNKSRAGEPYEGGDGVTVINFR